MSTQGTLVVLFCLAAAVALLVPRRRVPYTVALVLVGLVLGGLHLVEPPHLTRELLFTFILPGLLFEAAFHLDLEAFRQLWRSVLLLAVPGVALTVLVTAGLLWAVMPWSTALVFGAVVAATDPVAVTALFREVHAPRRLETLVEAESLFNDGTGVIALTVVLSLVTGEGATVAGVLGQFAVQAGGGLLVGVVAGVAAVRVIGRVEDAMIELALTTIAAYGSFALADGLGASGVLATVTAGMICGGTRRTAMTDALRAAAETFWRYAAFALNSIVFLLIGFEVPLGALAAEWPRVLAGFLAMLVARAALVWLLGLIRAGRPDALPRPQALILVWGGLRGALSMVLALSLPETLADRPLIVSLTLGAVVGTLVIQGLTMPWAVRFGRLQAAHRELP